MAVQSTNYIYEVVNEEQRNLLQHSVLRPKHHELMLTMLEDYGLRQRLEKAKENSTKVSILEAGCGDGYFLQDFADLLQEYGLLQAADLNGVDISLDYILGAEKRAKTKASWSKINYYQGDITLPLEQNFSLKMDQKLQFDCICSTLLFQYLPDAKRHMLHLYNYLKPGGIFYVCDSYMVYGGPRGWEAPIPELVKFGIATDMVRSLNGGKVVADEAVGWLQEAGATQAQAFSNMLQANGSNQASVDALRYYIAIVRNATPLLLAVGLISKQEHDEILASVFKIGKEDHARLPFIHTLAQKPL